jgi:hypothetical protein
MFKIPRILQLIWVALLFCYNSVAPEPEGSSLCSQEPAISPCHEPTESTPHPAASLRNIHSDPILSSTPWLDAPCHGDKGPT